MNVQALQAVEKALIQGDLSALNEEQRLAYYRATCESLGLNPLTRPFEYLRLNGRLVLYATRAAADQLRQIHGVTVEIVDQKQIGDLYLVHVRARTRDGRQDEDIGAISIAGLKGDALANAILKCITKAKRRVTLSICGLGWLDETEVDAIPAAERLTVDAEPQALAAPDDATRTVLDDLTERQRGYFIGLCRRHNLDPALLVQARQITTVKEVSELIDLLRTADQPVPSGDYAFTSMQLIARRFGVSEDELTEALRQADPQWNGDWAALKRWQLLWLETQAYAMAQANQS
jgi:hypothetical protein